MHPQRSFSIQRVLWVAATTLFFLNEVSAGHGSANNNRQTPARQSGWRLARQAATADAVRAGARSSKLATVHHMVGNTYTYRLVDWMTDLAQIEAAGFDAVALNLGPDCWQKNSVDLAYQAAAALNTKVKLFWSFDMTTWPQTEADAKKIAAYINEYARNAHQLKVNGLPFVSTFSGDQYAGAFGNSTVCAGWNHLRSLVHTDMYFVPGFFLSNDATVADVLPCVEGLFQWDSAWATTGDAPTAATDLAWMNALGNKTYMAGVSPSFFTHYGADSLNKNFVYPSENNYATRWAQVTNISAPMVQVITWNDYGESHYIGGRPSSVQLEPGTTSWVNNHNHLPWARISKPFIDVYKHGSPAALASDTIVWEYRVHPAMATASGDPLPRPTRAEKLKDQVYITAYLSAPAEIRANAGSRTFRTNATAGLSTHAFPFAPGNVTVGMWRGGVNVGGTLTGEVHIVPNPVLYNYNPVVEQFFHDPTWEACK